MYIFNIWSSEKLHLVSQYMWVNKKTVAWQNGEGNTLRFEVQHPCCVSQITQLNSRRLKVKTQLYIYIYRANDGNT